MQQGGAERARILSEALPYIRKFTGKTLVVKYGGAAALDAKTRDAFARDIVLLRLVGMNPVVVHGGGPQVSKLMRRLDQEPRFVEGLRVTDHDTINVVEMVLGQINKDLATRINRQGGRAVGLSGKDAHLVTASKLDLSRRREALGNKKESDQDLGFVGKVERIDPNIISVLGERGFIPVIAPIGADAEGNTYNINADQVAGQLAEALNAEKLILLTDAPGLLDADGRLLSRPPIAEVRDMLTDGSIKGGMLAKIDAALEALQGGIHAVHILDGRAEHALLLEIFTDHGIGTLLTPAS